MIYKGYLHTAAGTVCVADDGKRLISVTFCKTDETINSNPSPLTEQAVQQLGEYFCGKRKQFNLPLNLNGTDFQKRVWQALCSIPYGETKSYQDIAAQVGNPKACRAVGSANHKNKLMIVVPCHRVIAANGSLAGYAGGVDVKEYLLKLEETYK